MILGNQKESQDIGSKRTREKKEFAISTITKIQGLLILMEQKEVISDITLLAKQRDVDGKLCFMRQQETRIGDYILFENVQNAASFANSKLALTTNPNKVLRSNSSLKRAPLGYFPFSGIYKPRRTRKSTATSSTPISGSQSIVETTVIVPAEIEKIKVEEPTSPCITSSASEVNTPNLTSVETSLTNTPEKNMNTSSDPISITSKPLVTHTIHPPTPPTPLMPFSSHMSSPSPPPRSSSLKKPIARTASTEDKLSMALQKLSSENLLETSDETSIETTSTTSSGINSLLGPIGTSEPNPYRIKLSVREPSKQDDFGASNSSSQPYSHKPTPSFASTTSSLKRSLSTGSLSSEDTSSFPLYFQNRSNSVGHGTKQVKRISQEHSSALSFLHMIEAWSGNNKTVFSNPPAASITKDCDKVSVKSHVSNASNASGSLQVFVDSIASRNSYTSHKSNISKSSEKSESFEKAKFMPVFKEVRIPKAPALMPSLSVSSRSSSGSKENSNKENREVPTISTSSTISAPKLIATTNTALKNVHKNIPNSGVQLNFPNVQTLDPRIVGLTHRTSVFSMKKKRSTVIFSRIPRKLVLPSFEFEGQNQEASPQPTPTGDSLSTIPSTGSNMTSSDNTSFYSGSKVSRASAIIRKKSVRDSKQKYSLQILRTYKVLPNNDSEDTKLPPTPKSTTEKRASLNRLSSQAKPLRRIIRVRTVKGFNSGVTYTNKRKSVESEKIVLDVSDVSVSDKESFNETTGQENVDTPNNLKSEDSPFTESNKETLLSHGSPSKVHTTLKSRSKHMARLSFTPGGSAFFGDVNPVAKSSSSSSASLEGLVQKATETNSNVATHAKSELPVTPVKLAGTFDSDMETSGGAIRRRDQRPCSVGFFARMSQSFSPNTEFYIPSSDLESSKTPTESVSDGLLQRSATANSSSNVDILGSLGVASDGNFQDFLKLNDFNPKPVVDTSAEGATISGNQELKKKKIGDCSDLKKSKVDNKSDNRRYRVRPSNLVIHKNENNSSDESTSVAEEVSGNESLETSTISVKTSLEINSKVSSPTEPSTPTHLIAPSAGVMKPKEKRVGAGAVHKQIAENTQSMSRGASNNPSLVDSEVSTTISFSGSSTGLLLDAGTAPGLYEQDMERSISGSGSSEEIEHKQPQVYDDHIAPSPTTTTVFFSTCVTAEARTPKALSMSRSSSIKSGSVISENISVRALSDYSGRINEGSFSPSPNSVLGYSGTISVPLSESNGSFSSDFATSSVESAHSIDLNETIFQSPKPFAMSLSNSYYSSSTSSTPSSSGSVSSSSFLPVDEPVSSGTVGSDFFHSATSQLNHTKPSSVGNNGKCIFSHAHSSSSTSSTSSSNSESSNRSKISSPQVSSPLITAQISPRMSPNQRSPSISSSRMITPPLLRNSSNFSLGYHLPYTPSQLHSNTHTSKLHPNLHFHKQHTGQLNKP